MDFVLLGIFIFVAIVWGKRTPKFTRRRTPIFTKGRNYNYLSDNCGDRILHERMNVQRLEIIRKNAHRPIMGGMFDD